MSKKKPKAIDPKDIFAHSERFLESAGVLSAQILAGNNDLAIPMFVNCALGLELALKSLLGIERELKGLAYMPIYEHKLGKLFISLGIVNQKKILKHAREFAAKDSSYANLQKAVGRRISVKESLAVSSAAFEKLRYAYEISRDEYTYAAHPVDYAVRKIIIEYHPEWPHVKWTYHPHIPPTFRSR